MFIRSQIKGFSVIELIVSVAIMVAIVTMVSMNQRQFGSGATLKNIMNNMSLTLRQAQIYGVSVKQVGTHNVNTVEAFSSGFGLHFNINATPTGDNTAYIFFVDRDPNLNPKVNPNPNGMYGSGMSCPTDSTSECLEKVLLSQGHTISDLCYSESGVDNCGPNTLDISFVRPNVEAKIIFDGNGVLRNNACVEVSSSEGKRSSIVVYTTGQISVRQMSCVDAL